MSMNVKMTNEPAYAEAVNRDQKQTKRRETTGRSGSAAAGQAAAKTGGVSAKNEEKLSAKAQELLKKLREKYGDYDFFVGNSSDDLKSLAGSGSKEFSVIFSESELERMANDEKYAADKMKAVETAVSMSKKIAEREGFENGLDSIISKISVTVDDGGKVNIFAELEKVSEKQREWIEKTKEKHAEERKAEEKKAAEKAGKKNLYQTQEEPAVKRTTVEASTVEELFKKIDEVDWSKVPDSHSGDRFNFMA